ncbi:MAG TPA: NF038143 family protein [Desulfobacterales bacterium]|nr:NF038143 family protein [Desulfobacterales bacterium]
MKGFEQKKEMILQRELMFANAIGAKVFEKPQVHFWMVLIPILFLYFIYRMQRFKSGRMKFDQEFMTTRCKAMDLAVEALETGVKPNIDRIARESGITDALEKPYAAWLRALVEHYDDLLAANGESFEALVRSTYHNRTNYLLTLNRLNTVEKEFYAALKPQLAATEGAAAVIEAIEEHSRRLRRDLAEQIFA